MILAENDTACRTSSTYTTPGPHNSHGSHEDLNVNRVLFEFGSLFSMVFSFAFTPTSMALSACLFQNSERLHQPLDYNFVPSSRRIMLRSGYVREREQHDTFGSTSIYII